MGKQDHFATPVLDEQIRTYYIHTSNLPTPIYMWPQKEIYYSFRRQRASFHKAKERKELITLDSMHLEAYTGKAFKENILEKSIF